MSLHQLLEGAAQRDPRGIAISHGECQVTWGSFRERVARHATLLRSSIPTHGDKVAVLAANVPEHMEVALATLWAGLVLVPVNTRLSIDEQEFILKHCECRRLLADSRQSQRANELGRRIPTLSVRQLAPCESWVSADDAVTREAPMPFKPVPPHTTAAIFYTGGTTGRPKGAQLSHVALLLQGLAAKENYRLDSSTVYVHSLPMFHLADFAAALGATAAGARHCFLPEFSPVDLLDAIERNGVDTVGLVPTMLAMLLDAAAARPGVLGKLKNILYGAAPIQEPTLLRLLHEAPGVELYQIYGQTELGGACTVLPPRYHVLNGPDAGHLGSAGRPLAAFVVRTVDGEGQTCPAGEVGEIQVSGPGLMTAYWNDPKTTESAIAQGWLRTGDLGIVDEAGFVTIVGRSKDMIITGGENVFSGEVESALMTHPAIDSAAVIGVPDSKWGESVHAVVVLRPGQQVTEQALIEHCRARIAHYKCPRSVTLRSTALPLSGVGKVRKVELRQEWLSNQLKEI